MSKIKLLKILKEVRQKNKLRQEMNTYARKIDTSLEKLKTLMRRDGYDV